MVLFLQVGELLEDSLFYHLYVDEDQRRMSYIDNIV
jgi:hypothetical protein